MAHLLCGEVVILTLMNSLKDPEGQKPKYPKLAMAYAWTAEVGTYRHTWIATVQPQKVAVDTTRKAMYVQRNIKVRSRNHCCCGKAKGYYILWACAFSLSYPACNAHAPYFIVICGLSSSTIFFSRYLTNGKNFWKKNLLNLKCVFWFSVQLLSETVLLLRRIQLDISINVQRMSCKVRVILVRFWRNLNSSIYFRKILKFQI